MKLILKLLIKAMLPLVAMAGIAGYGVYMKGGDPMALYRTVWAQLQNQGAESGQHAGDQVNAALSAMQGLLPQQEVGAGNQRTILYRWVDDNGVTQFSQQAPLQIVAERVSIDPNVNVLQAQPREATAQPAVATEGLPESGRLPGIAGVLPAPAQAGH